MHKGINSTLDEGQTAVVIGGVFDDAAQPIAFHPTQDPISSTRQTHALSCGSKTRQASVGVAIAFEPRHYTRDNKTGGAPTQTPALTATAWKAGDASPHVAYGFYSNEGSHGMGDNADVSPAIKIGSGLGIPSPPAVAFNWQEGPSGSLGMSDADSGGEPPLRVHQTLAVAEFKPRTASHWDDPNAPHPTLNQSNRDTGQVGYSNQELFSQRGAYLVGDQSTSLTLRSAGDTMHRYADAKETDAVKALQELLCSVGAKTFAEWGFGVLASFFPKEILQQAVHGSGICQQGVHRHDLVSYARESTQDGAARFVREMWQGERAGCPSCRWQSHEQRTLQLAAYLQELSQPGTQASQVLHDLRKAAERAWVLRDALPAVQKMGESADGQGQRICSCAAGVGSESDQVMWLIRLLEAVPCKGLLRDASTENNPSQSVVRRLTVVECEFLQGFPRDWTSEGIDKTGKRIPMADAPRYRQLGNAVTVNVANWLATNVARVYAANHE